MPSMPPEVEHAIVEAEAMTQTSSATIERHGGYEDGVEEFRAQVLVAMRLMHSQRVARACLAESHETHDAAAQRSDARQVDVAATGEGKPDQRIRAEFLGHRCIDADAFARREPVGVSDVIRDGVCSDLPVRASNRAAAEKHVEA